jgi:hypothetical protein
MKNLIKKVLREESQTINMMDFWANSPKVTDVSDNEQMDKLMWHMIDYVDFPSDGNFRRINSFIESLIRYGLIDIEFYTEMYKWLNRKVREIHSIEEEFELSLDYVSGDDSFSDWKWHVLSLGKTNFERLKEGYDDVIEVVEGLRPIESFAYAWPHPYDFISNN